MSRLNRIQNEIKQLEGGRFQNLCDLYIYRKNRWNNIHSLGSQEGTDKPTIGIPDTYYYNENSNEYILVMYGTSKDITAKLAGDIKEAIEKSHLDERDIKEIICCHTSSNIKVEIDKKLRKLAAPIKLTLIGIDTICQDLLKFEYQDLTKDFLGIEETTEQVWKLNEFVSIHDKSKTNAKLSIPFIGDNDKIEDLIDALNINQILVINGAPGTGKTRLAIEICSRLPKDSNVISVKSNNLSAYQDIKDALNSNCLNYLLLDDANTITSLKAVLDLLMLPEYENNLKIIMTIRSYAYNSILNQINPFEMETYEQKLMDDESIDPLINKLYKEIPGFMLTKIKSMSRGNPRLVVLATEMIKEHGYERLNNGEEILINYYSHIIKENEISNEGKKVLFILSFFQKLKFELNEPLNDLLNLLGMTYSRFHEILYDLHDKELCDIYLDKATKISDQSLADYIIIDFISKSKRLTVREIFASYYPKYEKELINLINTVNEFDSSQIWDKYIKEEIKNVYYEIIDQSKKEAFLNSFAVLIPFESIEYVYNKINQMENKSYLITEEEFDKNVKSSNINDPIILILCRLSNSEKMKEAVQLLLQYLNKRQDKVLDVFQAVKEFFNIESELNHYLIKRNTVIESFSKLKNKSKITAFLLIKIAEDYLKFSGEQTSWYGKGISIHRYSLVDGDYLIKHHKQILEQLLQIYQDHDEDIKLMVDTLILNYPVYEVKNDFKKTVKADLLFIEENFFGNFEKLNMRQENIVSKLKSESEKLKLGYEPFSHYIKSPEQKLYNALIAREAELALQRLGFEEYEQGKLNNLLKAIENYNSNYKRIFNQIDEFLNDSLMKKKERKVEESLYLVFTNLNKEEKIDFLSGLFQSNYSIRFYHPKYFMKQLDYNSGVKVLKLLQRNLQDKWQLANLLTSEVVDNKQLNKLYYFINNVDKIKLLEEYSILDLNNYVKIDLKIVRKLYEYYSQDLLSSSFFIPNYLNEGSIKSLVDLMENSILKEIYLNSISEEVDRTGVLFNILMDDTFVYQFLKKLHLNSANAQIGRYNSHFKCVWKSGSISGVIKSYVNYLVEINKLMYIGIDPTLKGLFESNMEKSKSIVKNEIGNSKNEEFITTFMNLATEIFDEEFLLDLYKLLKERQISSEVFEKLTILKGSRSWTGSFVPLLDRDIEFLDSLLEIYNGASFIPHSSILMKMRDRILKVKEKELLDDYFNE